MRNISPVALAVQHGSNGAFGGDRMTSARRFPTVGVALCGTVVLASWVVGSLAVLSSASFENAGAVPAADRRAPTLTAGAEVADAREATATSNAVVANA